MRTFEELKQLLIQVKESDYRIPDGVDVDDLIDDMLKFIGHTDHELRDVLIYPTFDKWGCDVMISTTQMKYILDTCLDEQHLFYRIGEKDTDSVFTRSFSMLIIPVAFCMHEETSFLADDDVLNIKETVLRYIKQEKDFRGYVDGKGWAHSIAHVADALQNIVFCFKRSEDWLEILDAIKTIVFNGDIAYAYGEDERIADAFVSAFYTAVCDHKVLTTKDFSDWIENFSILESETKMPARWHQRINRKNFLKSVYVMFLLDRDFDPYKDDCDKICKCLFDVLEKL